MALLIQLCLVMLLDLLLLQLVLKLMELYSLFQCDSLVPCQLFALFCGTHCLLNSCKLTLKWLILLQLAHFFPYTGTVLVGGLNHNICIFPCGHFKSCMQFIQFCSLSFFANISSKSFTSLSLFITAAWALYASILVALTNTCSLVTHVFSSVLVISLIISANISLSLSPLYELFL